MVYYGGGLIKYDTFWNGGAEVELNLAVDNVFHGEDKIQRLLFNFRDLPVVPATTKAGSHGRGIREIAWVTSFRDHHRHACAFEFVKDRVYGFMFHPEAKKRTWSILYNFYDRVCLHGDSGATEASL